MNAIGNYLLSVCAAALLAAVAAELAGSTPMGRLVRYLGGLFVALTVVSALLKLELPDVEKWIGDFRYEGQAFAADGAAMANDAAQDIIKQRLEAYILDKAASCGSDISVVICLNEEGIPESVTLEGDVSVEAKKKLIRILDTELGLGEEAQYWIG